MLTRSLLESELEQTGGAVLVGFKLRRQHHLCAAMRLPQAQLLYSVAIRPTQMAIGDHIRRVGDQFLDDVRVTRVGACRKGYNCARPFATDEADTASGAWS